MNPEHWEAAKELFLALVDRDPEHRAEVLQWTPEPVRGEVRRLLANSDLADSDTSSVDSPVVSRRYLSGLASEARVFEPGQVILDRFAIGTLLGAGGMGEVYEAYDRSLCETIAIKTIRTVLSGDPAIIRLFRQEVQRARRVAHPNVCRVHEIFSYPGVDGQELLFLTMERVDGPTLSQYLAAASPSREELESIALQLCEGLHAAHSAGLIHRDFKPGNILIERSGGAPPRAVITDFGLARRVSAPGSGPEDTLSGRQGGTPPYMAPELLAGRPATRRSDIYALGVVLFRMGTGRYPFTATGDLERAQAERRAPPSAKEWNPALPKSWVTAIARCLRPEPLDRPESAASVAAILRPATIGRRVVLGATAGGVASIWLYNRGSEPDSAAPLAIGAFEGPAGEPALARLLPNLFRLTLASSRHVRLLPPAAGGALAEAPPRTGLLAGRVEAAGTGLQLKVSLQSPGRAPASAMEGASSFRELPGAVRRASVALGILSPADPASAGNIPLEEIDTANLEAMEALLAALADYSAGNIALALALLRTATAKDPEFALAYVYMAIMHSSMRREDLALGPAERAVRLQSRLSARVRPHAEAVYAFMCGDYLGALANYETVARLYPNEAPLQRHLAQMYTILYRHADALPVTRRAVAIDAASPQNCMMLASALADAGQFRDAAAAAAEAIKRQPDSPLSWAAEGYVQLSAGQLEAAIGSYERITARRDLEAYARSFQIRALLLAGRLAEAGRRLQLALGVAAGEKDRAHEDLFRYWSGQLHLLEGNPGRAAAEAAELAARDALPPSLFSLRAAAELAAGARQAAICRQASASAAAIHTRYPSRRSAGIALQCQALTLAAEDRHAEALLQLEEAEAQWSDISVWWSIAESSRKERRWPQAAAAYKKVLRQRAASLRFECILNWISSSALAALSLVQTGQRGEAKELLDDFHRRWGTQTQIELVRQAEQARALQQ